VSILTADTRLIFQHDGTIYARSPHRLGPYPARLTERLEHWARVVPDRSFLARRDGAGHWRHLSYREALPAARSIAQALIDRELSAERPLLILSGNSLEHALLGLGAMMAGVPYAPVAPSYSLLAREFTTLRALWQSLRPGLVFAAEGPRYERALAAVVPQEIEIVTVEPPEAFATTPFSALLASEPTPAVDRAHAAVGPDTVAKILYTSGSTGTPKGVINTQRMLCSNQEMLRTVMPLLSEEPPVLCDWLPWNHTFGGNHNIGIVLYNGGTLYIDDGRPVPGQFETTLRNLREIPHTAYFNVPRGYDCLVPHLKTDPVLRETFFSRLKMLFCAAAALRQQVADDLAAMAREARDGRRLPFVTGLGATESAPFALCAGDADFTGGRIGVPVPGVELKLAPVGGLLEGRLRGPNITPGYWNDEALTAAAFDDEGFYRLGDALRFFDAADPSQGFAFEGRITEDFKLSSGTWVRVGTVRAKLLAAIGELTLDVVITAPNRDSVGALIFPNADACRALAGLPAGATLADIVRTQAVLDWFEERLRAFAAAHPGSSTAVTRALLLEEPPAIDAQEATDKGSVNQKAVLARRAALVEQLYAGERPASVIDIAGGSTLRDHQLA
jgi:feruloyl-CoA synthase